MSTIELKNKLHSLIDSISDNEKLKALVNLLNTNELNGDWYDELSISQKTSIDRGLTDIKNGRIKSDQDAKAEIDKFISEKYA